MFNYETSDGLEDFIEVRLEPLPVLQENEQPLFRTAYSVVQTRPPHYGNRIEGVVLLVPYYETRSFRQIHLYQGHTVSDERQPAKAARARHHALSSKSRVVSVAPVLAFTSLLPHGWRRRVGTGFVFLTLLVCTSSFFSRSHLTNEETTFGVGWQSELAPELVPDDVLSFPLAFGGRRAAELKAAFSQPTLRKEISHALSTDKLSSSAYCL